MSHQKILIVDDEAQIRSMLNIFLETEDFEIVEAENGKAAIRQLVSSKPDLVVLDLGMPEMDGQEVIKTVRQFSNTPIIVLTARSDDREVVEAFSAGADDYVIKPFRAEVLLARIRANLRHAKAVEEPNHIENGPIVIDLHRHEVQINGMLVPFTPKEFALLESFVRMKGRMLTHKQILRDVWGPSHTDDTQYLRVYIGQIRDKLERTAGLGTSIVSEAGIGYRMDILPTQSAGEQSAESE